MDGNEAAQKAVSLASRVFDILLVSHPWRTSMGVCCGVVMHSAVRMMAVLGAAWASAVTSELHWSAFLAGGVFLFHSPLIFSSERFDEKTEADLRLVRIAAREGHLTPLQKRQLFLGAVARVREAQK